MAVAVTQPQGVWGRVGLNPPCCCCSWLAGLEVLLPSISSLPCFFFALCQLSVIFSPCLSNVKISHGDLPALCSLLHVLPSPCAPFSYTSITSLCISLCAVSLSFLALHLHFLLYLSDHTIVFLVILLSLINCLAFSKHSAVLASSWDGCSWNPTVAELSPLLFNPSPLLPVFTWKGAHTCLGWGQL